MGDSIRGQMAIVTGASSGIGWQIAHQLASRGCDIVAVARRSDRLETLKGRLEETFKVAVHVVSADLSVDGAAQALQERIDRKDWHPTILVNNAGFGVTGNFSEQQLAQIRDQLAVNVAALTELSWLHINRLRERKQGGYILQIASIAAFQPNPFIAVYGAAKTYVRSFSEALAHELDGTNISCTCVCPGATSTEFAETANLDMEKIPRLGRATYMSAEQVAATAVTAMLKRKRVVVTGMPNKIATGATRLLPRQWLARMAAGFLGGSVTRLSDR